MISLRRYTDHGGIIRWDKNKDRFDIQTLIPPKPPKKPKPRPKPKQPKPITRVSRAKILLNKFLKQAKGETFTVSDFAKHSGYRQETARRILDRDGYSECYEKLAYRKERQYNLEECLRISNEAI